MLIIYLTSCKDFIKGIKVFLGKMGKKNLPKKSLLNVHLIVVGIAAREAWRYKLTLNLWGQMYADICYFADGDIATFTYQIAAILNTIEALCGMRCRMSHNTVQQCSWKILWVKWASKYTCGSAQKKLLNKSIHFKPQRILWLLCRVNCTPSHEHQHITSWCFRLCL